MYSGECCKRYGAHNRQMHNISYNVNSTLAFTRHAKLHCIQGKYLRAALAVHSHTIILGDCSNAVLADLIQKSHYS